MRFGMEEVQCVEEEQQNDSEQSDCVPKDPIEELKHQSREAEAQAPDGSYGQKDLALDILGFVLVAAGSFGWMLLMLLIASFVLLGMVHFEFTVMIIISIVFAVILCGIYVFRRVIRAKRKNRLAKERKDAWQGK